MNTTKLLIALFETSGRYAIFYILLFMSSSISWEKSTGLFILAVWCLIPFIDYIRFEQAEYNKSIKKDEKMTKKDINRIKRDSFVAGLLKEN